MLQRCLRTLAVVCPLYERCYFSAFFFVSARILRQTICRVSQNANQFYIKDLREPREPCVVGIGLIVKRAGLVPLIVVDRAPSSLVAGVFVNFVSFLLCFIFL